jgi:hypothetical protein
LPHEFGHLPLTYFQTLVDRTASTGDPAPARSDTADENDDVKVVDVDALIRKGQRAGFAVET